MASFTGTLDKCKACDKTVYFVDLLSADGATFHKSCFKCTHCKGTLVMSNYSSMDGVLYCKPHFEQLFKESGNFSKNFQNVRARPVISLDLDISGIQSISLSSTGNRSDKLTGSDNVPENQSDKLIGPERENSLTRAPSKLSALFSGTLDKCPACNKTVYPLEKVTMEGESFHKSCFKCAHGGCPLTHSSYAALDGILYCKVHFQQLFMEKGNYQHVLDATNHKKGPAEPAETESEATEQPKEEGDVEEEEEEETVAEEESDKAQEQS
ncbi:LIM domain-containing protein PLIM2a [Orobanche minor]